MNDPWMKLSGVFEFVKDAFVLTICFWLGTLSGAIVLGIAPTMMSLVKVGVLRGQGEIDKGVWRAFWHNYRSSFRAANTFLLPLCLILAFLLYDYQLAALNLRGVGQTIAAIGIGTAIVVVALMITHACILRAMRGDCDYRESFKALIYLPVANLLYITVTWILVRLSSSINGIAVLLVWGVWALLITKIGLWLDSRSRDA